MSFVDLMESHVWSEADIVNRTEAMAHAVLSIEEETILSRKVLSVLLGAWTMTEDDLATQAKFAAACAEAHQAGVEARADMVLLQAVLDYEADPAATASAEVLDLFLLRNPLPKEDDGKIIQLIEQNPA